MEVKQHSSHPQHSPAGHFFRPALGRTAAAAAAALLTPKMEAAGSSSDAPSPTSSSSPMTLSSSPPSCSSVLMSTVIKTEPRSDSPPSTPVAGHHHLHDHHNHHHHHHHHHHHRTFGHGVGSSSSSASMIADSANNPSSSSAMHPISLSLLHSSPTNSNAGPTNTSFYGGSGSTTTTTTTTTTSAAAAAAAAAGSGAPALNASSPSPSPLKRTRQVNSERSNGGGGGAEEWLPLPSPMSVDSGSPPPPTVSAAGNNGHSTLPPSVSSNGYSPSPMSTGSYEPPYSPGGKLGREDLSPPGSVNGYSVDSFGDAKKKKGPAPRQQEELCLVCGDRASGYHYNALTCEGCKGFFRRSITKNAVYQCKYGNGCEIDMYMRRKCQECRLKKCLTVGMRPECVVPEYQCAVKREAKKAQKEKDRPNSASLGSPDIKEPEIKVIPQKPPQQLVPLHAQMPQQQLQIQHLQQQQPFQGLASSEPEKLMVVRTGLHGVKPLSPEQEELINRLVYFQEEFDQPSEDDMTKISQGPVSAGETGEAKFKHITEMTILTVQLTVEFSKRLPGFDTLLREDQITLLKACSSEVMMLRCARRYDTHTDSIVFATNLPYTRDAYAVAGVGETADALFRFGRHMSAMKVDNAEYGLLTAIVIFSERPNLVESRKVEKIQEIYLEALQAYVGNHRPRPMTEFGKLLSVLTELRTLGTMNSEMCFSLKLKNKKLPPFLAEIWDVHS